MVVAGISVAVLIVIVIASRGFEQRQRRLGRWDEYGPLEESDAPDMGRCGGHLIWHSGRCAFSGRGCHDG